MKRLYSLSDGGGKMASSKRRRRFSASEDEDLGSQCTPKRNLSPMSKIYNSGYRSSKPAELFRKDLISAMKLPDSEQLDLDSFWYVSDSWKQEWERGVQVPVNSSNVPLPCVRNLEKASKAGSFKLPKKLIRNTHDQFFSNEHHILTNIAAKAEKVCRYDMDDLDCCWLSVFNDHREDYGLSTVDEMTMELVLEDFENQCSDKFQEALRTEEGLGIEYDEDVVCDVCRSPDSEEGNEMVFCDSCNICVHQACYGITTIPEGSWICRTCALNIKPQCILCPVLGGAMKSTRSGQKWAHVSCALWIPEVSIGCAEKMEPIVKISQIPTSRWALICTLCRERIGACIQCSVKQCKVAYHVTCAFENHLEMKAIFDETGEEDGVKLRSYCPKHSKKVEEPTSSNCQYMGSSNNKNRKHKKEVKSSTISDEDKHNARLQKIRMMEAEFHNYVNMKDTASVVEVDANVVEFLFQYWKLKRKANFNKPLITAKADESNLLCQQQENSLYAKTKLFVHLRQDLERVRNLCYMVSRREKLYRTWLRARENVFWKQLEVLTDDSLKISSDDVKEVLEANHGDSVYDIMYSFKTSNSQDTSDEPKDKLASARLPNPYAKCYLRGIQARARRYASREASMDGSCSSYDNTCDSTGSTACPENSTIDPLSSLFGDKSDAKMTISQAPVVIKLESEPHSGDSKKTMPNGAFNKCKAYENDDQSYQEDKETSMSESHPTDSSAPVNTSTWWKASDESLCDTALGRNRGKLRTFDEVACKSNNHTRGLDSSCHNENPVKRGRGRPRKFFVKGNIDSNENSCKEPTKDAQQNSDCCTLIANSSQSNEKEILMKRRRGRPRIVPINKCDESDANAIVRLTSPGIDDKCVKGGDCVTENSEEARQKCEEHKFNEEDSSSNEDSCGVETSMNDQENTVRRRRGRSKIFLENKICVKSCDIDKSKETATTCNSNEDCNDNFPVFKDEPDILLSEHGELQCNIHNTRYQMRVRNHCTNIHHEEKVEISNKSSISYSEVRLSFSEEETLAPGIACNLSDSGGSLKASIKNCEETKQNDICEFHKTVVNESLNNDNSVSSIDSPSSNDKENIVKHPKARNKRAKIQNESKDYIITSVESVVEKDVDKDVNDYCDDKHIVDVCDKQLSEPNESSIHNTRYQMRVRNQGNIVNQEENSEVSLQLRKQPCDKVDTCNSIISNSNATCKTSAADVIRSHSSAPLRQSSVDITEGKIGPLEIKDSIRIQRRPSRRILMDREADVAKVLMKSAEKPEQARKQDAQENLTSDKAAEMPSKVDGSTLKKSLRPNSRTQVSDDAGKQKLAVKERSLSVTIELLDAALQLPISEHNIATLFPKTETRSKRQCVETPLNKDQSSDFFSSDVISKTHVVENLNHPVSPRLVIRLHKDPNCQNWQKGPMPTNGTTAFKVVQNDWDAEDVRKLQPVGNDASFSDSLSSEIFAEDSNQRNGHRYSMRRRTSKYTFDVS